jgi:hypothetical protein
MRRVINLVIFSALLAGAALVGSPPAAFAATQDGNWSVLIITDKGDCDRGYRYGLRVSNGRVSYRGDSAIDLAGTVASNGVVNVSIKLGDKGANGTGHLTASSGAGTWHGIGSSGTCAGHWEAERN